ncbi:dTDP-glucose 4,6-dehydratase [Cohnella sp.]|uniref:dTDP-glucose 4,6-dehydratase n=1 Tax=Cohnella sp. TaxID=1883426 RepID=UPI00356995AA
MRVLVTGGAGFVGSNFVHYLRQNYPQYEIVIVDLLTYAGNLENLKNPENRAQKFQKHQDRNHHKAFRFIKADIVDKASLRPIFNEHIDAIINFAAESHVDRSIRYPSLFVKTNIMGTQTLLDLAREFKVGKYIQISTDEVYGSLGADGLFTEETPLAPNSPYAASKASADLLVRAYHETYGLDVNITRCSNNYGPYQFPEKLIPFMLFKALSNHALTVYGDGLNVRDWLHVEDHCRAIDLVLHNGKSGEVYNIGGNNEYTNLQVIRTLLRELKKPESLITHIEDRLGHDRRYAIDASKIRKELGWTPKYQYENGIKQTIKWYLNNEEWLRKKA